MFAALGRRLLSVAARRGLIGGSRPWLIVLLLLVGRQFLRWISGQSRRSLSLIEHLEVGDRIQIASLPPSEFGQ